MKKKKTVRHAKSRPHGVRRATHESPLTEKTAIMLAVFFSLVALFLVLVNKKQSDDFRRLLYSRMQEQMLYVPAVQSEATPTPRR